MMSWEAAALEADMERLRNELFEKLNEMEKRIIEAIQQQKEGEKK